MTALLNSNWICCVMRISFSVTTMSEFFFGQPGLVAAGDAGRVRAEVVDVGIRSPSLSGSGQPSSSLPAVEVLGLVRALVGGVGDAVGVVVGIGAAVVVEVAVLVLGLEDALVARVGDAVAVGVAVDRLRARPRRTRASVQRSGGLIANAACALGSAFARCASAFESCPGRDRSPRTRAALRRWRARAARTSSRRSSRRRRRSSSGRGSRPRSAGPSRTPLRERPAHERSEPSRTQVASVTALMGASRARVLRQLDGLVRVLLRLSAKFDGVGVARLGGLDLRLLAGAPWRSSTRTARAARRRRPCASSTRDAAELTAMA